MIVCLLNGRTQTSVINMFSKTTIKHAWQRYDEHHPQRADVKRNRAWPCGKGVSCATGTSRGCNLNAFKDNCNYLNKLTCLQEMMYSKIYRSLESIHIS